MLVLHDIVPIVVHIETIDASFESDHPIQIEALHVPEPNTTPIPTTVGSASTSKLHLQPQSQHHPLTQNIANTSPLVVSYEIRVGATLVATCNILWSVGRKAPRHSPTPSTSISLPRGQSTQRGRVGVEVLSRRTSVRGSGTRGLGLGGGSRARDATTINDAGTSQNESQSVPPGNASNDSTRNQVRSNRGSIGLGQRNNRGMKCRKKHQGMVLRFSVKDYNES